MLQKMSNYLASKIGRILKMDKEREEIIAYGAFGLIQTLWSLVLTVVFGLIFNVLAEVLIVSLTAVVLRKFSGGAHATSPNRCAVLGIVVSGGFALIIKSTAANLNIAFILVYAFAVFTFAYFTTSRYSPVDS
ncbi:MAG: accessory gene regulator B family protein, partial [Firmicutes bacterium]|nr:accessory gene regulator B family protein [Bacillota bacterium]